MIWQITILSKEKSSVNRLHHPIGLETIAKIVIEINSLRIIINFGCQRQQDCYIKCKAVSTPAIATPPSPYSSAHLSGKKIYIKLCKPRLFPPAQNERNYAEIYGTPLKSMGFQ